MKYRAEDVSVCINGLEMKSYTEASELEVLDNYIPVDLKLGDKVFYIRMQPEDLKYITENF